MAGRGESAMVRITLHRGSFRHNPRPTESRAPVATALITDYPDFPDGPELLRVWVGCVGAEHTLDRRFSLPNYDPSCETNFFWAAGRAGGERGWSLLGATIETASRVFCSFPARISAKAHRY